VRTAKRLGLIKVDERRLSRRYNDANRITIISREWCVCGLPMRAKLAILGKRASPAATPSWPKR